MPRRQNKNNQCLLYATNAFVWKPEEDCKLQVSVTVDHLTFSIRKPDISNGTHASIQSVR